MKEKGLLKSKEFSVAALVISVIAPILFNAARATWVFVDITLNIEGFTRYLLYAMVIIAVLNCALCALRLYDVKKNGTPVYRQRAFSVIREITFVLSLIFFIAGLIFAISVATSESSGEYFLYLKDSLITAAFFILVPFLAVFLPLLKGKARRMAVAISLAVIIVIAISFILPSGSYEITSAPTVIDKGDGYSVVFATSDHGTGYVEYTFDGKDYKIFDTNGGRLISDTKIHSIDIPYEHLDNNTYKVGSTRVFEQYSYGSYTGKEVVSEEYPFYPVSGDDITFLVLSDWHTHLDKAYAAAANAGDYDALILMGDSSPGLDFEDEAVRNIIEFAGTLTNGKRPVLYTRGNHETRGAYASKLADALGLDEFYYTADLGNYSFVVLDSGEDKDDSHPEYGGMTDYNTYRAEMVEWLKGVKLKSNKVITLSHSWCISDVEKDLSESAWNELDRLSTRLIISGHTHQCRLLGETDEEKAMLSNHPDIIGYMDGGNSDDRYIASKMILSSEGILLEAYDNLSGKVFEEKFEW